MTTAAGARAVLPGLLTALALAAGCGDSTGPPNVLLFVVDTLRADALGAYGNTATATPNVDRLAEQGVLFERAYAGAPWTRASLASLLTGLDSAALDVQDRALPVSAGLLSERFHAAGYHTAGFVGNPNVGSYYGFSRGFDEYVELYRRRHRGAVGAQELVANADEVADQVVEWLDSEATEPFFLFVLMIDPHHPYQPPPEFDRLAGRSDLDPRLGDPQRRYLGEVAFADRGLGRVLDALDRQQRTRRTLVVFTSDHGEEFGEHGESGHGSSLYEEVLRVPLVLRFPPRIDPGQRVPWPVRGIDLAPTLLALAGLPVSADLHGRALFGAGKTPEPSSAHVYADLDFGPHHGQTLIVYPWKLVVGARTGGIALFRLDSDPGEARDVASQRPAEREQLATALAQRRALNATRRGSLGPGPELEAPPKDLRDALEALGYLDPADEAP